MSPVIEVNNVSKKYPLGTSRDSYLTLRESLSNLAKFTNHLVGKWGSGKSLQKNEFWALRNVSFEVQQGEVLGIIGANGAGKSTLLKILSRITAPTSGEIKIRGRIASLLEVGTGFNAELTGRENIFLNGAILGMSQKEIKNKFEEIVDFSGVEKFIDTPLKHYSSGMAVRLAFAVAANLDAEILLIDEILAVGDIRFQRKSLGRMKEIVKEKGKTILFVSHNMNAIEQLCTRCQLIKQGKIAKASDEVPSVIRSYVHGLENQKSTSWKNNGHIFPNKWFKPLAFYLTDKNNHLISDPVSNSDPIWIHIEAEIKELTPLLTFGYALYNEDGQTLFWSYPSDVRDSDWPKLSKGKIHLRSQLPGNLLTEGIFKLELIASLHMQEWIIQPQATCPSIYLNIYWGYKESSYWMTKRPGFVAPLLPWGKAD